MKRFFILVFLFSVLTLSVQVATPFIEVSATFSPIYARVKYNNVYFYKEAKDFLSESKLFLLEQNYFVKIVDDTNEIFYRAQYLDLEGYVKKSEVERVVESPQKPYLEKINFSTSPQNNVALRKLPQLQALDASLVIVVPKATSGLVYYGKITGEEAILGLGNIWYYCKYAVETQEHFGYIYSPLTTNLTTIAPNLEAVTLVNEDFLNLNQFLNLSPSFKKIMIAIVFVPTLFIVYLFFLPAKDKK